MYLSILLRITYAIPARVQGDAVGSLSGVLSGASAAKGFSCIICRQIAISL